MASGILNSRPKQSPTAHPGQDRRAAPITNPIPKRAMKAAVMAARLSGKFIGTIIPMSIAPNAKPQITPSRILDIALLFPPTAAHRLPRGLPNPLRYTADLSRQRPSPGTCEVYDE